MASPNPFKSSSASSPRHGNGGGGNGNNGGGNSTTSSVRRSFTFTSSTKSSKNTNHQPPFTPCSSPIFLPERVLKQNEDSENIRPRSGVKSPTPLPKGVKGFMAPTISAVFKANSPKKKVLSEKNEGGFYVSGSPFSLRNSLTKSPKSLMEEEGHDHMEFDSTVKTVSVEDWKIPGKNNYNITIRSDSSDSESVGNLSKYPDPIDEPIQIPPYDPKTNYLSPRPKFLRYKPAKELLKSQETLNGLSGPKDSKQDEEEGSCMSEVTNNTKEDHTATSKIEEETLQENVIQECENKIEDASFNPRVGNKKEGEGIVKSKVNNVGKAEGDTLEEEVTVVEEEEEEEEEEYEEEEEEGSFWSIKKILMCVFVLLSGATAFHFYGDSVGLSACRYRDVLSRAKLDYLWKSDVADIVPDNQQAPMNFIMENNGHEESIFSGSELGIDSYEEKEVAFIPEVKEEVGFTDEAKKEETAFPDEVKQEATALTDKVEEEETDKSNMQETVAEGDDYERVVEENESHNVEKSVDEGEGTILEEDTVQTIVAEGKGRVVEEEGVEEKGRREEEFRNVDNSMFADGVPLVDSSGEPIREGIMDDSLVKSEVEGVVESVKEVEGVVEEAAEGFVQSEIESVVEAGEAFVSSKVESVVESADAFVKSMDESVVESADTFVKSIDGSVVEFADTFAKSVGESVVEPEDAFAKSMDENVVESEDTFAKSIDENLESEDSFTKLMDENVADSQDSFTKPMDESFVDTFVHSVERRDGETSDEESYVEEDVNAKFEDLFTLPSEQVSQGFAYSKSPEVEEGHKKEVKFSDSGIEDHEAESEVAPVKIFSDIKEEIEISMADSAKVTYDQLEDSSEIISQDVISITELQNADIPEVINEEELGGREDSSSIFERGLFSKASFAAISALAIATMAILWKLFRFSSNDAEQSSRKVEFLGSSSPLTEEETIENAAENAYVTQNAYDTRNTYATTANHHIRNSSISPPKVHLLSEYLPEEVNSTDRFRSRRGNTVSWATQSHRTPQTTAQFHQVPQTTTSTVSDFTETSSYGSFTTFDKIHLKEAEKITPVRRSSRIRQQKGVTSPVQS